MTRKSDSAKNVMTDIDANDSTHEIHVVTSPLCYNAQVVINPLTHTFDELR